MTRHETNRISNDLLLASSLLPLRPPDARGDGCPGHGDALRLDPSSRTRRLQGYPPGFLVRFRLPHLRLGDLRILTDPFVSNGLPIRPDENKLRATLGRLDSPHAILVNHTHFDHFLDAPGAMRLQGWEKVPMVLSESGKNLMAGEKGNLANRCHAIGAETGHTWSPAVGALPAGHTIQVTAFRSKHTPHLSCGKVFLDGDVKNPRTSPADPLIHLRCGEVYNYLVEMNNGTTSFRVFYLGGAVPLLEMPQSMPPDGTRVDLLILAAPGANHVKGFPGDHILRLRPRHILVNHYNTFLKDAPDEQLTLAGRDNVKLAELSRSIQAVFTGPGNRYEEFRALHFPAITVMDGMNRGRNVIHIPNRTKDGR